jgi:hypothetical protein
LTDLGAQRSVRPRSPLLKCLAAARILLARTLAVILLAVICGAIALGRLHTYDEPLDRDVATYVVIGGEMLHGRALYTDLWDNKPPALYAAFAAAQLWPRIHATRSSSSAWCAPGPRPSRCSWGERRAEAPWPAVDRRLLGHPFPPTSPAGQSAEHRGPHQCLPRHRLRGADADRPAAFDAGAVVAGLGLGAAIMLKVITAPLALAWSVVHVIAPPAGTPRSRAAVQAFRLVGHERPGGAGVAAYFAATGRWTDLWATLVVHNRYYAGPLLPNLREGCGRRGSSPPSCAT